MGRVLLERQVLGRMLCSFDVLQLALRHNINARVFYGPEHAQIFDAIVDASIEANGRADAIHVVEQLITDDRHVERSAGVLAGLAETSNSCCQSSFELISRLSTFEN